MLTNRPRRLPAVSYTGYQRYFVTTCAAFRRKVFMSLASIDGPLAQLRQADGAKGGYPLAGSDVCDRNALLSAWEDC
jgi:hypothetical protein